MGDISFDFLPKTRAGHVTTNVVAAAVEEAGRTGGTLHCGWVPFTSRTLAQLATHAAIVGAMPPLPLRVGTLAERRYPLWRAAKTLLGRHLKYNYQQTGSCVGAGGGNMAKTAQCCEIVLGGDNERYNELWWPYTYGKSRERSGMTTPGEGSTGSGWAEAATKDGTVGADEAGLPAFGEKDGWLVIDGRIETQWSARIPAKWDTPARQHLFGSAAQIRSVEEAIAAITNGYPLTQASMFGLRSMVPKVQGSGADAVRIGEWDGSWSHQTYVDECWDHPQFGMLFRWGNNWGADAHGAPTGEEPPGGFYIKAATMDRICKTGEVYAFSKYAGFPGRELDFRFF